MLCFLAIRVSLRSVFLQGVARGLAGGGSENTGCKSAPWSADPVRACGGPYGRVLVPCRQGSLGRPLQNNRHFCLAGAEAPQRACREGVLLSIPHRMPQTAESPHDFLAT